MMLMPLLMCAGKINPFPETSPLTDHSALWIKDFFLWDWLAVVLSDPLSLSVKFRLHEKSNIGTRSSLETSELHYQQCLVLYCTATQSQSISQRLRRFFFSHPTHQNKFLYQYLFLLLNSAYPPSISVS